MALLNKSGIGTGNIIQPEHVTNVYDALNGSGSYDIVATGSFTGSFRGDGSQLTGTSKWTGSNPISRNSNVEITGSLIVSQGYISIENFNGESRISLNSDEVAAIDYAANHYAALSVDGTLTLKTNISESYLRNSNVTNPSVILEFPNKTAGSYTLTTTDDLNSYTTTSSFNTFTSSIQSQVNSLTAATSSYVLTSTTSSMLAPYVLTSSTSSMTVSSASFAQTASYIAGLQGIGQYIPVWNATHPSVTSSFKESSIFQDTNKNLLIGAIGMAASKLFINHSSTSGGLHIVNTIDTFNTTITATNNSLGNFLLFGSGSTTVLKLTTAGNLTLTGSISVTNQINLSTGSATTPSLTFTGDTNTGMYRRSLNNTICFSTNGVETVRIAPVQLIVGNENFTSDQKYAQPGVHADGWVSSTLFLSQNMFFGNNGYGRAEGTRGGFALGYIPTSSNIPAPDGEKIIFNTLPSGSSTSDTGSNNLTAATAFRIDCNYQDGGTRKPGFETAHGLTIGELWSGTNTGIGRDATTGRITAVSSDQRLKTNIQTLTGSLDIIQSLRGTQFEWTNTNDPQFIIGQSATGSQIGLIAQEVNKVLPQVVKPNGVKDYLTVEYDKLVAVLIEAVKEQQQQINNLQQQINNLYQ